MTRKQKYEERRRRAGVLFEDVVDSLHKGPPLERALLLGAILAVFAWAAVMIWMVVGLLVELSLI